MGNATVLVTGAGGYLGRRIARSLLEAGADVVLWLRPDPARTAALRREFREYSDRIRIVTGDLCDPLPFAAVDPGSIDTVIHAAAVTRFNVERDLADRVNVEGLRKLVAWARGSQRLERLCVLSTVYSNGLREGRLAEEPLASAPEFANHYERSKWEAERLLVEEAADLPWQIQRVATVIANDEDGRVEQQNAFHNTLKLLYYGLLSIVPGEGRTPLYFVTARFAADAICELSLGGSDRTVYHVCHARAESATLARLIDVAFRCFAREESFRKRRILPPILCDATAFDSLAAGIEGFGGPLVRDSLRSILPFAPQLFTDKSVANERLVAELKAYAAPDPLKLIERTCAHLVETRWGKEPIERVH